MCFLVHACDISNPAQPFEDFREWGLRIQQEFVDLYDAEIDLRKIYGAAEGAQDAANGQMEKGGSGGSNNRAVVAPPEYLNYKSYKGFAMGQAGFAKTFVLPTWRSIGTLIPKLQFLVERIEQNIAIYEEIAKKEWDYWH